MYDWYHSGHADVISITDPHQGSITFVSAMMMVMLIASPT